MAAIAALSFTGSASAHHLWLEPDGQGAKLYFGEFEGNLREASPGLLDRFKPLPEAKVVGAAGAQPLKVEKSPSAFVVSGTIGAGDSIVAEQARVTERKQGDKAIRTLGRLAARYVPDFAERAPVLTLDIVPTGKPGAFKVVYDGKPLAKAKLELKAESGWKRELHTDEQGAFTASLPWRGTYVIEIEHVDAEGGRRGRRRLRPQALRDLALVQGHARHGRSAGSAADRAEARDDGVKSFPPPSSGEVAR